MKYKKIRYIKVNYAKIILALLILVMINNVNVSFANAGPVYLDSTDGYTIIPVEDNSVNILSEYLTYNIKAENQDSDGRYMADIEAKYIMENKSDKVEKYTIAFLANGTLINEGKTKVNVSLNEENIDLNIYKVNEVDESFDAILKKMPDLYDINNHSYSDYAIILFEIELEPNTQYELKINYSEYSRLVRNRFLYYYTEWMPEFKYYLEPAKYWNDFQNLYITINVPEGFLIDNNSIEGFELKQNNVYTYYSEDLPDNNLQFSLKREKLKDKLINILTLKKYIFVIIILTVIIVVIILLLLKTQYNQNKKDNKIKDKRG